MADPTDNATTLMNAGAFGWNLNADPVSTEAPSFTPKPNILMLMVDQLRLPQFWLTSGQQGTVDSIAPNIAALRQNSYQFTNFFVAAQACTPSRATLLTGLYAPQTAMFATQDGSNPGPNLSEDFPTFGNALQDIAGYSPSNILWFGKWNLSNYNTGSGGITDEMPSFGFNYGRNGQIQYPSTLGSPVGSANQGSNGYAPGIGSATYLPCDAAIYEDFNTNWTNHAPSSPWFICVSFVNPHDMSYYPGFLPSVSTFTPELGVESPGPQGVPYNPSNSGDTTDFPPSVAEWTTQIVAEGATPTNFNYESRTALQNKSTDAGASASDPANFLQPWFQNWETDAYCDLPDPHSGPSVITSNCFPQFMNWYYYMLSVADAQIGNVLADVVPGFSASGGNPSSDTAIIFLSDHGDYGVSHGLHSKGGAVYEEALRVPLYVVLPSQQGATQINQMCSMVDVFRLVVELAYGGGYIWEIDATYVDQIQNQDLLSFIQEPSQPETRFFTGSDTDQYTYILTTTDETYVDHQLWNDNNTNIDCWLRSHVMCIRTKSEDDLGSPLSAFTGAKLAIYSKWLYSLPSYTAPVYPIVDGTLGGTDLIVQDYEYYDYENYQNRTEIGNDYQNALTSVDASGLPGSGAAAHTLLVDMVNALGNLQIETSGGTVLPASGLASTLLTRKLQGHYSGQPMYYATAAAFQAWYTWMQGVLGSACSS